METFFVTDISTSVELFTTNILSRKGKAALPLRESMSFRGSKSGKYLIPAFVIGTLALGMYLDEHEYMLQRESIGVVAATPGPLRGLAEAVRDNVPGAYESSERS